MMAGFLSANLNTDDWLAEAQEVFSDKNLTLQNSIPTIKTAFRELGQTYREYTSSWWEVQSLDNYIKQSIVPRGLRISLQPSERVRTESLKVKWEKEATGASLRFMRLLLEEEKTTLDNLTKKLRDQIDIALKFRADPEFEAKEREIQTKLLKHQTYIKERKHTLFLRDFQDFKEGKVYNNFPRVNRRDRVGETDISSSEAEFSDAGERRGTFRVQRGKPANTRSRAKKQAWERSNSPPPQGAASGSSSSLPSAGPSFLGQQRQLMQRQPRR